MSEQAAAGNVAVIFTAPDWPYGMAIPLTDMPVDVAEILLAGMYDDADWTLEIVTPAGAVIVNDFR